MYVHFPSDVLAAAVLGVVVRVWLHAGKEGKA